MSFRFNLVFRTFIQLEHPNETKRQQNGRLSIHGRKNSATRTIERRMLKNVPGPVYLSNYHELCVRPWRRANRSDEGEI
jgi:hypothetical protein